MGDINMTKWVDFKTVRENLRFPAVLSHYGIEAHGNSDQVKIICPFHDDHKPSCGVNIDKHVFNCFACDAGGNALDFIAHMEGLDPSKTTELRKAAFMAAETFGIEQALKKPVQGSKQRTTKRDPKSVQSKPAEAEKVAPAQKTKKDKPVKPSNQPLTFELKLDASHPFLADKRRVFPAFRHLAIACRKRRPNNSSNTALKAPSSSMMGMKRGERGQLRPYPFWQSVYSCGRLHWTMGLNRTQ